MDPNFLSLTRSINSRIERLLLLYCSPHSKDNKSLDFAAKVELLVYPIWTATPQKIVLVY